ncbi:hypothetical protein [Alicyclobacillus fastidiosus]|uniref:Uncharacterized protein n=1 Tax=Alicyclobacillus fastidiosus TaxID=392011 RepID=A0ABV5AKZ3_9BACL
MESKLKHLEMIQGVINRLANNSFLLKGWGVTLAAAVVALDAGKGHVLMALLPILAFWILDAYFLWNEKLFRELYNDVRRKSESQIDFSMSIDAYKQTIKGPLRWMFSDTLFVFWGTLTAVLIVIVLATHHIPVAN